MELWVNIKEIRNLIEDQVRFGLSLTDKSLFYKWVHPRSITGLNKEELVQYNRARYYNYNFPLLKTGIPSDWSYEEKYEYDFEKDDQILIQYLSDCTKQRFIFQKTLSEDETISLVDHVDALLYLATEYETKISFLDVPIKLLNIDELEKVLNLIERTVIQSNEPHIKSYLVDFAYLLFLCDDDENSFAGYPVLEAFLKIPAIKLRVDNLNNLRDFKLSSIGGK